MRTEIAEGLLRAESASYQRHRLVGAGSFGSVYYGSTVGNGSPVAIKHLHRHFAHEPRVVARFEREADPLAGFEHPNIVRLLDRGRDEDGLPFIVMEWVDGWTLAQLVDEKGRRRGLFSAGEAAEIGCQVLDGLEAVRLRGLVHRDIKPKNLMVTVGGRVKIMDFGIAKEADLVVASGSSVALGAPAYMAPEQFRGERLDCRTDLYALGVTLYQLLAGRPPFEGEAFNGYSYMYHHLNTPPPSLAALRPGLEPGLVAAVERCLAKSPDDRFSLPRDVLNVLRPFATPPLAPPEPLAPALSVGAGTLLENAARLGQETQRVTPARGRPRPSEGSRIRSAALAVVSLAIFIGGYLGLRAALSEADLLAASPTAALRAAAPVAPDALSAVGPSADQAAVVSAAPEVSAAPAMAAQSPLEPPTLGGKVGDGSNPPELSLEVASAPAETVAAAIAVAPAPAELGPLPVASEPALATTEPPVSAPNLAAPPPDPSQPAPVQAAPAPASNSSPAQAAASSGGTSTESHSSWSPWVGGAAGQASSAGLQIGSAFAGGRSGGASAPDLSDSSRKYR